jgi:hypothetical protein
MGHWPPSLDGGLLLFSLSRFTLSQSSDVLNIGAGSEDAQVIQIQAKLRYKENTKWFNQWYNIVNWRTMSKVMHVVLHTNMFIYFARRRGRACCSLSVLFEGVYNDRRSLRKELCLWKPPTPRLSAAQTTLRLQNLRDYRQLLHEQELKALKEVRCGLEPDRSSQHKIL